MSFDWTISEKCSLKQRAKRYRFAMDISLTMGFESWQMMWPMKLTNISTSGLLAEFLVSNPQDARNANDLLRLLTAEPNVCLQLNPCGQDLLPASVDAVVIRSNKTSRGLELAFRYEEQPDELQQLFTNIHEQSTKQGPSI